MTSCHVFFIIIFSLSSGLIKEYFEVLVEVMLKSMTHRAKMQAVKAGSD